MIYVIGLWTFLRAVLFGSAAVAIENLALRHQLLVLQRSVGRPRLARWDRILWVWLSRVWVGSTTTVPSPGPSNLHHVAASSPFLRSAGSITAISAPPDHRAPVVRSSGPTGCPPAVWRSTVFVCARLPLGLCLLLIPSALATLSGRPA